MTHIFQSWVCTICNLFCGEPMRIFNRCFLRLILSWSQLFSNILNVNRLLGFIEITLLYSICKEKLLKVVESIGIRRNTGATLWQLFDILLPIKTSLLIFWKCLFMLFDIFGHCWDEINSIIKLLSSYIPLNTLSLSDKQRLHGLRKLSSSSILIVLNLLILFFAQLIILFFKTLFALNPIFVFFLNTFLLILLSLQF